MVQKVGCVVPFVNRLEEASICNGGNNADKAFEIYNNLYNDEGLYKSQKRNVLPLCKYFVPSITESRNFKENRATTWSCKH